MKPEPEPGALITAEVFHICSPSTYPTIFSSRVQQPHVPLSESVAHEWSSPSSVKFAKLRHSEHELKAQLFSSLQSVMTSKAANLLHKDLLQIGKGTLVRSSRRGLEDSQLIFTSFNRTLPILPQSALNRPLCRISRKITLCPRRNYHRRQTSLVLSIQTCRRNKSIPARHRHFPKLRNTRRLP